MKIKIPVIITIGPVGVSRILAIIIPKSEEKEPNMAEKTKYCLRFSEMFLALTAGIITSAPVRRVPRNFIPSETAIPTIKR